VAHDRALSQLRPSRPWNTFSLQLGSLKREVSKAPSVATSNIATLECRGLPPPIRDTRDAKTPWAWAHGHSARSYGVRTKKSRDVEPICSKEEGSCPLFLKPNPSAM
jgi:hypothetical protein